MGTIERGDAAGLDAFDANPLFDRLGHRCQLKRLLQQAKRVAGLDCAIDRIAQAVADFGRVQHQISQCATGSVVGG